MNLPKNIQVIRDWLRETQSEFGARFGIGKAAIWKWETGNSEPNIRALMRMEDLTGLPMNRIVRDVLTVDLLDSLPDVLKDSEQQALYGRARGGGADLHHILEEMNAMRRSMEAAQEAASTEREENAKFRKEFEFLKKKVDVVDAELLRIAGKKK